MDSQAGISPGDVNRQARAMMGVMRKRVEAGPTLVMIEWVDSRQPLPEWQWLADLAKLNVVNCRSVGFLIQDDDYVKVLAPNVGMDADGDPDQASGLMVIPTQAVVKISRLTSSGPAPSCQAVA